jgi:hypothetical protein
MNNCYSFEILNYNDGMFNKCTDATYIIHLENNGRYVDIQKQLNNFHPNNIVYILFNKGYKCKNNPKINKAYLDLTDAYNYIFKHSISMNYNNILILEDDFIFSPQTTKTDINRICKFINSKSDSFVYKLGCIPLISLPLNNYNYISLAGVTHACIYSKLFILKTLKKNINYDWDHNASNPYTYNYYKPICYQLFPMTENKKEWGYEGSLINFSINILKLDQQCEPGYSIHYMLSKIIGVLLIILFLFIFYKII